MKDSLLLLSDRSRFSLSFISSKIEILLDLAIHIGILLDLSKNFFKKISYNCEFRNRKKVSC